MRKRPTRELEEKKFIENAVLDKAEKTFPEVRSEVKSHLKWPVKEVLGIPRMEEGSNLNKPISLPLKEFEWKTLDKHTKKLGVGKSEWIRHAIYKLIVEEQNYFFNINNSHD